MSNISLAQYYRRKEQNETGTSVNKTYMVPLNELYIEPGYNIRSIKPHHVQYFKERYLAGDNIPAFTVKVTEKGIQIIDGHHRFLAAQAAITEGLKLVRHECKDFDGDEAGEISFMIRSSQGERLSPLDYAEGYRRLKKLGHTVEEIAKETGNSTVQVRNGLALVECDNDVKELVRDGVIAATEAVKVDRQHGAEAARVITEAAATLPEGKKVTAAILDKPFSAKDARRVVELLQYADNDTLAESFSNNSEYFDEFATLLAKSQK